MNKQRILAALCALFLLPVSLLAAKSGFDANIKNLGTDTIFVVYIPLEGFSNLTQELSDTIVSKKGKFHFDNPLNVPIVAIITPKATGWQPGKVFSPEMRSIHLNLNPGEYIALKGTLKKGSLEYTMKGSAFNKDIAALKMASMDKYKAACSMENTLDSVYKINPNDTLVQELSTKYAQIFREIRQAEFVYLKKNLDKDLSGYLLLYQERDTLAHYYTKLSENVQKGIFNALLTSFIKQNEEANTKQSEEAAPVMAENMQAPDFTLKNLEGKDFTLSSLKSKYIVLDFWGSWCVWCIRGIPKMKEYYEKYKGKFEIVGIDCGDTEEAWKEAVKTNSLPWLHVINSKETNKDVTTMYGIRGFPTKIILDSNLKIVATIVGESEDFYQKLDLLLGGN